MVESGITKEIRKNMRGGDGEVTIANWIDKPKLPPNVRLMGVIELPPGASIGEHAHEGEAEVFHIISGAGEYNDDGEAVEVKSGDTCVCASGQRHGIKNTGGRPLIFNAVITLG